MARNPSVRQTHRAVSIVFTLFVLVNIALNLLPGVGESLAMWVGMLTLVPLVVLLITGLYLFVLPYTGGADPQPSGRRSPSG